MINPENATRQKDFERSETRVKSTATKKIAGMMGLLLIISLLTPILSFAASLGLGFSSATYSDGNVTGSVYSGVYADGVTNAVYVDVYDPNGGKVTTVQAVYSSVYNGIYSYSFTKSISNYYSYINLLERFNNGNTVVDSVYKTVYNTTVNNNRGVVGGGGGGGIGGGGTSNTSVSADANGNVDATALKNAFASSTTVTIKITGDFALLPASALVDAAAKDGASVTIVSDNGTYTIPLSVLKLDDLAKALGISVADLTIKVSISKVTGATADAIKAAASSAGATLLSDAVDFNVQAVSKDGKTVNVDFGNTYVSRTLNVNSTVDSSKTTGVLYNTVTKTFSFVPSTFATADGKTVATLKRNGNSIYTVASFNKSFSDITTHWAKADVQLLANKLVVDGMTDTTFAPENNITRAQFAALVVRSLGLSTSVTTNTYFKDVQTSDWYAGAVAAAAKVGLINGYEDGTFAPNKQITREELAALVIRAVKYAGVKADVTASQQSTLLAKFTDSNKIVWAQAEIAAAINAGIINGLTDTTIGSNSTATRAQSATMLKRFLVKAGFIS